MNSILDSLGSLYGLPGYALVALSCIVLGYVLRALRFFPNQGIPLACVLWAMVLNPLLANGRTAADSPRVWLLKNILIGMIVGFLAWILHKLILRRFEDKIAGLAKFLGDEADPAAAAPPSAPKMPDYPSLPPKA